VVSIATLVGGIFGVGGGGQLSNAVLYEQLLKKFGAEKYNVPGSPIWLKHPRRVSRRHPLVDRSGFGTFLSFDDPNDPEAPTTIRDQSFPYETPTSGATTIDPSTTALPDDAGATLAAMGAPGADEPDCAGAPNPVAASVSPLLNAVAALPAALGNIGHSNALVVDAAHSVDGHPLAVFGPQVSYFAPQILM